jgi:hypothetical protein
MKAQTRIQLIFTLLTIAMAIAACSSTKKDEAAAIPQCRGTFYDRNKYGALRKFSETMNKADTACLLDQVPLTTFEQTTEDARTANVQCVPQIMSATLIASGNFYSYRNGRELIDLDGATGTYRRITYGQDRIYGAAFTRDTGCFYVRDDATAGRQLLINSVGAASTEPFVPTEIFRVDQVGSSYLLTRNDDISDWGEGFCPELRTPDNFCAALRNGNYMFEPNLSLQAAADLTSEAILIRTKFSYVSSSKPSFDSAWSSLPGALKESVSSNWIYAVKQVVDTPRFTDVAWRGFIMGTVANMPDTSSPNALPVCYAGLQSVTLANGQPGKLFGEICYISGVYTFTGQ